MNRVLNFSAGPSMLPVEVLEKAAKEMLNCNGSGMSVMEMSHRSSSYEQIQEEAKNTFKELMGLDDEYEILFLQGGGHTQFAMIPLNLLAENEKADYLVTGSWAKKAYEEAKRYADVKVLASSSDKNFSYIQEIVEDEIRKDVKFLYVCTNNTIYGTRIRPETIEKINVPIVADMSSNILSEEYDMKKFDLIFAGAQKNIGPSGVTLVAMKKNLAGNAQAITPTMLNYQTHLEKDSMYNTPPCYNIYISGLVAQWVKENGGVKEMEKRNKEKAKLIYDFIDNSKLFQNPIEPKDRSLMNVVFVTGNKDLDAQFVKEAKAKGFENLKGHRSIGGMRASIYNAMPKEGVERLVEFMKEFEIANR
ncbi:phosphoserine aminotransferase apoenzyme [Peptoniphilus asaccharolyticus DSM 20463]|uniref:Phosphoserine aminotransferase n=1 Tax=Peptoniphilus asaccharolyticus DSM 20463 TaxID=573058 RepID=A0A1W1UXY5_PEPAS|nr:3-phosphoserine/phosphohydroxythreonine transaminase [Peptoniphilus asaccharolyticus]MBL7575329.1 3-phosphoserine/phosphohydroxythreonine transaminase [Peptoniphilus asaccharolyticus]SMB85952.1 phosphoserine aminotransferase apoenzyme [Peptoniphilus asaccharolyticus DSM 20463]